MRRVAMSVALMAVTLAIALALAGFVPDGNAAPPKTVEIQMTARKYVFNPSVITVKHGDHVKLVITATDRQHGFAIPAFGINQRLKKGVPTTVSFVASKAGSFPFRCSSFCGLGHRRMKGKLVVQGD